MSKRLFHSAPVPVAAVLNGIEGTISQAASVAAACYEVSLSEIFHLFIVRAKVPIDVFIAHVGSNVTANQPYLCYRGGPTGEQRSIVINPANALDLDFTGSPIWMDGKWRMLMFSTRLLAGLMRALQQVDNNTRELSSTAQIESFVPWANRTDHPKRLTYGAQAWDDPVQMQNFTSLEMAYAAVCSGQQLGAPTWLSYFDAWDPDRENLQAVTDALTAAYTTGTVHWAGPLDGSAPHIGPAPAYNNVRFVTANLLDITAPPVKTQVIYAIGNSHIRDLNLSNREAVLESNGFTYDFGHNIRFTAALGGPNGLLGTPTPVDIASPAPYGELPDALTGNDFDLVWVQPWQQALDLSSTLSTDLEAFAVWIATQPATTKFVYFAATPKKADLLSHLGPNPPPLDPPVGSMTGPNTNASQPYIDALWDALIAAHGADKFILAPLGAVIFRLVELGTDIDDLYDDDTHLSDLGKTAAAILGAAIDAGRIPGAAAADAGTETQDITNQLKEAVRDILLAEPRSRVRPT